MTQTPAAPAGPDAPASPSRRRLRRRRRRWGAFLIRRIGPLFVRVLSRTWRLEFRRPGGGGDPFDVAPGQGLLFALWHGRLLIGAFTHAARGLTVLVSPSDDGEVVTILLRQLEYDVIRGSSSRGGARAAREMCDLLAQGRTVVITPDGPRGPRHSMNPGLAWLASSTGVRVAPVGLVCDRAWRLSSWDAFTIPKPGARVVVQYGPLLELGPEADEAEHAAFTERVHDALMSAEREAFEHLGVTPDHSLAPDRR